MAAILGPMSMLCWPGSGACVKPEGSILAGLRELIDAVDRVRVLPMKIVSQCRTGETGVLWSGFRGQERKIRLDGWEQPHE